MTNKEKLYLFLCTFFCLLIVLSNLTYQKFVTLSIIPFYKFELSVGAILYPLTFIMTDLITEFYTKEKAAFAIKLSMVMNVFSVLIIMLMDTLPATSWSKIDNATFHSVFGFYGIAFIGSMIACTLSQTLDVHLYLWIKKLTHGRFLWLQNIGSTSLSLLLDTLTVIGFMAIMGVLPFEQMLLLVAHSYLWKFFFIMCNAPLFCIAVKGVNFIINNKNNTHLTQSTGISSY